MYVLTNWESPLDVLEVDLHFLKLLQKTTHLEILGTLLGFFNQHCPFIFPLLLRYKWLIALCNRGTFILYHRYRIFGGNKLLLKKFPLLCERL